MIDTTPETMPWWKSRVIVGALLSAALKILYLTGVMGEVAPDQEAAWLEIVVLLASFFGDAIAAHARVTQKVAPKITGSKVG